MMVDLSKLRAARKMLSEKPVPKHGVYILGDPPMLDHLPVLCCCDPDNLEGYAPAGLDIATREYEGEDGGGVAYVAHGVDLESIDGFVRAAHKGGGKKTWKKTKPRTWKK